MSTITLADTALQFHVGLNVADLARSSHFYELLLGTPPSRRQANLVLFEMTDPPLALELVAAPQLPGGTLNHFGLRLPDSTALVAVQRRLEEGGIGTQRQDGVECCYSRQTKFWVTDPDKNLIEIYVFEEDLDHSGFEDQPQAVEPAPAMMLPWQHRLTEPLPDRIPHDDGSLDQVWLEGTFNGAVTDDRLGVFLEEVRRVLCPGGKVAVHGMAGNKPFAGKPNLPGLASLVQRVPTTSAVESALLTAGFVDLTFETWHLITCIGIDGVELYEVRLIGTAADASRGERGVLYRGPFDEVVDDAGYVFRRGERVPLAEGQWRSWKQGALGGQFVFWNEV